ncbi:MAG: peroxiredoxin [Bryobacteraceae bacterium]|nr:peroxiredoxin [Bryobacteraceae bacterium]
MLDWLWSDPLPVGGEAPDFQALDDRGRLVSLREHRGKWSVVLIFYPKDETRLCTKQVCDFRDSWQAAEARDTRVYGVNPDPAESHRKFSAKHGLPFPLLVDEGQRIAKLYHCNGLIIKRTVYVIGKDGRIKFGRRGTPTPAEALAAAD